MIPSVLAKQLKKGLKDYIETTFPMTNILFKDTMAEMLQEKNAVFHEPYFSIPLPFRLAERETVKFNAINLALKPYLHQNKAFERLVGDDGRSTLIATGTGSGKTECFIYPILEYCYKHLGDPGIKALIIYPMNALASDQAKRLAGLIYNNPKLKGNVTAGMYVGGYEKNASMGMTKKRIITDHGTMLENPPDILLTNYKMLDYLLVRPKDARLWEQNKPEMLRYIAVDELHTFDGAQGTDLACLLRRLKARLNTQPGYLCCIGTSATMGTKDSVSDIKRYASSIFGETFEEDSVITEDRLSPFEFFEGYETDDFSFPTDEQCYRLQSFIDNDQMESFISCAAESWLVGDFDENEIMSDKTRIDIGRGLMKHSLMQYMITIINGNYVQMDFLIEKLKDRFSEISKISNPEVALDALFALISHAREGKEGDLRPFLNIMVQFWIKELRRFLAKVSKDSIGYAIEADLNEAQLKHYLPVINCRDCGETGWAGVLNERGNMTMTSLETFYNLYFNCDTKIKMLFPCNDSEQVPVGMVGARLCSDCLQLDLNHGNNICSSCGEESIPVVLPTNNIISKKDYRQFVCPFCGSKHGISLIGLRSTTVISALSSQLYSSEFNDDKKLLAFSDNVQDAAHRAGFFNYRTWKFSLRNAIQTFALSNNAVLPLDIFQKNLIRYWRDRLTDEEFVSFFIAPNMTWMRAYERMLKEGSLDNTAEANQLMDYIEKRVRYEVLLEYGLSSRVGRTLEKSGCSVINYDNEIVDEIIDRVKERGINELGVCGASPPDIFKHMVIGFIYQMKINGAFNDSIYNSFINEKGKEYMLSNDKIKWMPGIRSGRIPRYIYKPNGINKRIWNFDNITLETRYSQWIYACIDEVMIPENIPQIISEIILSELKRSEIVTEMPTPDDYKVYALDKSKVYMSTDITQFTCDKCGANISASQDNSVFWINAPCLRKNCDGRLYESKEEELDYYGKLYSNDNKVRIIAREHTGLLDRNRREELEHIFKRKKEERKPWDANLLSSTPTLEMGIDIGDLSTVVLCSMPPGQAQYLQRIGRAGRKDGNALTITVANAKPHDLYFYADPMEMIKGIVEPPQVFLRAPAVLERQFVAYCMDSWIKRGIPEKAIPKYMGKCLRNIEKTTNDLFPFNFLNFVQNNLANLLRTFIEMFNRSNDRLDDDTLGEIRKFAMGAGLAKSPMHIKVLDAFEDLKKQKNSLQENINKLKSVKEEIESRPQDSSYKEEIEELKNEMNGLYSVIRNINHKEVFGFMSDEGLLPNYAFPEAGMILKAVLFRKEESEGGEKAEKRKKYEKMVFEYNRNAASAISEFAPANSFYVDGKRLQVNQIDMLTTQSVNWRLCPNCSHGEVDSHIDHVASCPNCGSIAWADSGQVRPMLKVKMVYSNMPYKDAQIGDDNDDRKNAFYCKQLLVDIDEERYVEKAYQMGGNDFPFGYEFVSKATLREINFGEKDVHGERLTVSGIEEVRKGFKICKYCGYIQSKNGEPKHTFICPAKNHTKDSEPFEECLFLYREFDTEVLRILVPATTEDYSKTTQESFTAAFMLGLKKYFGNVDHLRSTISEAPVLGENYQKQYLVVYDTVPGGTGYLKQLMQNKNSLVEILEKSLEVLENCNCREEVHKDGCYHCLYAYRQGRSLGQVSRKTAIRLLRKILSGKDKLAEIERLSKLPVNTLFESELERNFIQAFEMMKTENREVKLTTIFVNSKKGYYLKVGNNAWEIEPQVTLDEQYGVAVKTRADFVFWPVDKSKRHKPIAVYTDGFTYHGNKCADDTLKREAIRRGNYLRVWSMSRKDVQRVFKDQGDYATKTLLYNGMPSGAAIYKPTIENNRVVDLDLTGSSQMELLMRYLELPDSEDVFITHAKAISLSLLNPRNFSNETAFNDWFEVFKDLLTETQTDGYDLGFGKCIFGTWFPGISDKNLEIFSGINSVEMKEKKGKALPIVVALLQDIQNKRTEKYEEDWNGFWHFYNIMQFSDNFIGVTKDGIEQMIYGVLPVLDFSKEAVGREVPSIKDGWAEVKELLYDDEAIALAEKLRLLKAKIPSEIGYELIDIKGAVVGECEMAWENLKVAALMLENIDSKEIFEKEGWIVFTLNDGVPPMIMGGDS